jgi:hypothetical protein
MIDVLSAMPLWAWFLIALLALLVFVLLLVLVCTGGVFRIDRHSSRGTRIYSRWYGVGGLIRVWCDRAQRRSGSRTPGE